MNDPVAVIICDMWDSHHCKSAERRVAEMAPRMNTVIETLRSRGAFIIHAPAGCMEYYAGSLARSRAASAPAVDLPVGVDWNDLDESREAPLPESLLKPGVCSCDADEPRCAAPPPYPWTHQIDSIRIADDDAVSDCGEEIYRLLHEREISQVLVMGVHANVCVLGRPYGIRQLVYFGLQPMLCRDLTDSFHADPRGHSWGTETTVGHIEQHWCPAVTSTDFMTTLPPIRYAVESDIAGHKK